MWRSVFRWLSPVAALFCWLPPLQAQEAEKAERGPPALQYAVAILCAILVLLVVCMPSRKSGSS
jgi:hypothetical protein